MTLHESKRRVALRPGDPDARVALAEAFFLENDLEGATRELEKALSIDGTHESARRLLVRVYMKQTRFTQAEALLLDALAAGESQPLHDDLADVYLAIGRLDDALMHLCATPSDASTRERSLKCAELSLRLGLAAKAERYLDEVGRLDPSNAGASSLRRELAALRGDLLGENVGPLDRGAAHLEGRTRSLLKEGALGPLRGSAAAAASAIARFDPTGAKRALVTAKPEERDSFAYHLLRAELALSSGAVDAAMRSYEAARDAREGRPAGSDTADRRIAEILQHRGEAAAAAVAWERVVTGAPRDAAALEAWGDALVLAGRKDEATSAWKRAIAVEPGSPASAKLMSLRRGRNATTHALSTGTIFALGWGGRGGKASPIEALAVPGAGQLVFTGNVGSVGHEAAKVAFSCVKARAEALGILARIATHDVHIHFVDTELSKDGPSAGLALALAAISAYRGQPLLPNFAATGEITPSGAVRAVGGLHEKLVAAHLADVTTVLVPQRNAMDLGRIPSLVRRTVAIFPVDSLTEALDIAFGVPASLRGV